MLYQPLDEIEQPGRGCRDDDVDVEGQDTPGVVSPGVVDGDVAAPGGDQQGLAQAVQGAASPARAAEVATS